ncbi:MAG: hypothetical protein ACLPY5_07325 [Candidatus Bathyarchaeia archaeon]
MAQSSDPKTYIEQIAKARRKRECFGVKNAGFVLLEVFPVESEKLVREGLKKLLERDQLPPVQTSEGVLAGGWSFDLGYLANADADYSFEVVKKDLPKPIELIEVNFGKAHRVNFCYYVTFNCFIKPEFQDDVETEFVDRESGINDYEPKIREYQMQVESFLHRFIEGIFLAQKTATIRCPSIRVLLADKIDFDDFHNWFVAHAGFLRYLGVRGACSKSGSYLISYEPDRLFKEHGIFAGLMFVSSKAHYTATTERVDHEIVDDVSTIFQYELLTLFTVLYWAVNKIEFWLNDWDMQISKLAATLRSEIARGEKLSALKPVYKDMTRLANDFEASVLKEEANISVMQRVLSNIQKPKSTPLQAIGMELDVLGDLTEAMIYVEEERNQLAFIRRKIDTNSKQCKQYTDFSLQNSMRNLTLVTVALSALALFVALLPNLLSAAAIFAKACHWSG